MYTYILFVWPSFIGGNSLAMENDELVQLELASAAEES